MKEEQRKVYKLLLKLRKETSDIVKMCEKHKIPFLTPAYMNVLAVIDQFIKNLEEGK